MMLAKNLLCISLKRGLQTQIISQNGRVPVSFKSIRIASFATDQKPKSRIPEPERPQPIQTNDGVQIYEAPIIRQVKFLKVFSLTSSFVGICGQPIMYNALTTSAKTHILFFSVAGFLAFFTFATPFLFHVLSKKYVLNIYYDEKKDVYTATTLSFFAFKKKLLFKVDDVYVPDIPGMFTSVEIKKNPYFIDLKNFSQPIHYKRMLHYDQPMDYHLEKASINESTSHSPKK